MFTEVFQEEGKEIYRMEYRTPERVNMRKNMKNVLKLFNRNYIKVFKLYMHININR